MKTQNPSTPQKFIISAWATAAILIVFLHNPFGEYVALIPAPYCNEAEKEDIRDSMRQSDQRSNGSQHTTPEYMAEIVATCTSNRNEFLNFSEWRSAEAYAQFFSPTQNALYALLAVSAIAIANLIIFKKQE